MNVVGLNDLLLRSLVNEVTEPGLTNYPYGLTIHLFKDQTVNDSLGSLDAVLDMDTLDQNFRRLSATAAGVVFARLTVERVSNKIRLNIVPLTTDLRCASAELFHVGQSTRSVYDHQALANQTLGNCIIYKPNNFASAIRTLTVAMPAVLSQSDRWQTPQSVLVREALTEKERFSENTGSSFNFGRRHYDSPSLAWSASVAVVFTEPVEADFIYFDMLGIGNVVVNRSVQVEVQNIDGSYSVLGTISVAAGTTNRFNFTKRTIRGVRLGSLYASVNANHYCDYYLQALTAGLGDYDSAILNSNTPITKAVLTFNAESAVRTARHRLPVMAMSVGDQASSADLKMTSVTTKQLTRSSIVTQTLLELDV